MFTDVVTSALWITLLPLAAFAVQILVGRRLPRHGDFVSIGAIVLALFLSVWIFSRNFVAGGLPAHATCPWIDLGSFRLAGGIAVDGLASIMLVVVTLVSTLVQLYSTAYMHDDPRYSRYFAYLSLFSFSMLGLVVSDNLFFLFVFWELVGVSSYFLIGFWFEKNSAADASKKAFLTNRVGDIGFFIGIMLVFVLTGRLAFADVFAAAGASTASETLWTIAGICLFCGAVGKSAQFPLHVWLPDAMEGPTPVSALIHAATMVAAGVYMVGRIYPILTPEALAVICVVGAVTAVMAASIALVQNDIKKVLAYSTVSQLGFMVLALGAGGYVAGLFHLVTHAAFKACLFLGSGSVIHAVHTQDIRKMGGLARKMPVTHWTFVVATFAIAGLPFVTSGFFSKDMIIAQCFERAIVDGGWWRFLPWIVVATAGLTAFYMFRLVTLTFWGEPRDHHAHDHAHESPPVMTVPLVILAALSLGPVFGIGGPGGLSGVLSGHGWFQECVKAPEAALVTAGHHAPAHGGHDAAHRAHLMTLWTAIPVSLGMIALSIWLYLKRPEIPERIAASCGGLHRFLENKWYFDELYQATAVRATMLVSRLMALFDGSVVDGAVNAAGRLGVRAASVSGRFDNAAVDGAVNAVGIGAFLAGQFLRLFQSGRVQTYIGILAAGLILVVSGWFSILGWAVVVLLAAVALPVVSDLLGGRDE